MKRYLGSAFAGGTGELGPGVEGQGGGLGVLGFAGPGGQRGSLQAPAEGETELPWRVVVGGLLVSTLFTLFLVPALFSLALDARAALAERFKGLADTAEEGA